MNWEQFLRELPLIAILRGVRPEEAPAVASVLLEAGFLCLEVPLNSPSAPESIRRIREVAGSRAIVGAGTVTTVAEVEAVAAVGSEVVISPNTDTAVIQETRRRNLLSLPGFYTASEAFAAMAAGAHGLKLFPSELAGLAGLKALKAVLPAEVPVFPVGGITPDSMAAYIAAGARGFGIGSSLYQPGRDIADIHRRALGFVRAWRGAAPRG